MTVTRSSAHRGLSSRKTNRSQTRKPARRHSRRWRSRNLLLETLESRTLLAAVNWIGESGNWIDAPNWSTGLVPGPSDDVTIDNPGAELLITLTATDYGNDSMLFTVLTSPLQGTLTGTAPNLAYTPTAGYLGPDSFTFQASDWQGDSNVATVSITVIAPNPLQVTGLTPTASGFSATFNRPLATEDLNLYGTAEAMPGPADVTLVGASGGPVRG